MQRLGVWGTFTAEEKDALEKEGHHFSPLALPDGHWIHHGACVCRSVDFIPTKDQKPMQETRWVRTERVLTRQEIERIKERPLSAPSFDSVFSQMEDFLQQSVLRDGGKDYEEIVFTTRIIRDPMSFGFKAEARYIVGEIELPFIARLPWPCKDRGEYDYILRRCKSIASEWAQSAAFSAESARENSDWSYLVTKLGLATQMNFIHIWTEFETEKLESLRDDYRDSRKVK